MPTLQELLGDFGVADVQEKTASVSGSDEIEALAAQYGFGKVAEDKEDEGEEDDKEEDKKEDSKEEKKASVGLDSYFHSLFPEDESLSKTAEEMEKVAYEENLGARAFELFAARFDRRIEKLASDILTGSATIGAATAPDHEGNVHKDLTIPQANKTNRPANASEKIDTTPSYTDEVSAKNTSATVGHFEQKHAAMASLAMRKAFILSQLES